MCSGILLHYRHLQWVSSFLKTVLYFRCMCGLLCHNLLRCHLLLRSSTLSGNGWGLLHQLHDDSHCVQFRLCNRNKYCSDHQSLLWMGSRNFGQSVQEGNFVVFTLPMLRFQTHFVLMWVLAIYSVLASGLFLATVLLFSYQHTHRHPKLTAPEIYVSPPDGQPIPAKTIALVWKVFALTKTLRDLCHFAIQMNVFEVLVLWRVGVRENSALRMGSKRLFLYFRELK